MKATEGSPHMPVIVSAFTVLAVGLFLANVVHEIRGFDQYMSCGHGSEREPKQFRLPQEVPCDFASDNWCNVPGETYPWQAVRRFVYENHGLMRRMYGDVRQGSILREEFQHHHPDDELDEADVPEEDVHHRYSQESNFDPGVDYNKITSGNRNRGRGFDGGYKRDDIPEKPMKQDHQRKLTEDIAWNEPFFGDVVAGVADDMDGGARRRMPTSGGGTRRGRELHQPYTANHIAMFEDEKAELRSKNEEIQLIGDEIRFQGLLPTAQLEAIANVQYVHSQGQGLGHGQGHMRGHHSGVKFSFGHQASGHHHHSNEEEDREIQNRDSSSTTAGSTTTVRSSTSGGDGGTTQTSSTTSLPVVLSDQVNATKLVAESFENRTKEDGQWVSVRPPTGDGPTGGTEPPPLTPLTSSLASTPGGTQPVSENSSLTTEHETTPVSSSLVTLGTTESPTSSSSSIAPSTPERVAYTNTEPPLSLIIEERRKPSSTDPSTSFLAATDAADEEKLSAATFSDSAVDVDGEDVVNDDYYQQTSEPATEQTQTPRTSQRPNNKYQKMKGVNACPVKEEVVAPYWANNTRGEVLALLNLYPFEQYIHWEKCTYEHKQMYCRDGCRCEQQYRLHRLLAFDPNNECRGIFSDWFKFPSCCVCKCYNLPFLVPPTEEEDTSGPEDSPPAQMTPRHGQSQSDDSSPSDGSGSGGGFLSDDDRDLYSTNQRTPRLRNYLDTEIDFGPANIEPLDQADYLAYQLSRDQEEQMRLQQELMNGPAEPAIVQHGYQPISAFSPEDDRVIEASQINGPAYSYFDTAYEPDAVAPTEKKEPIAIEPRPKPTFAYDSKFGRNASAPLPLIRQPRGVTND